MIKSRWVATACAICALTSSGLLLLRAQDPVPNDEVVQDTAFQYSTVHAECNYFGKDHDRYAYTGLNSRVSPVRHARTLAAVTQGVAAMIAGPPPGSATSTFSATHSAGSIDSYLQADWKAAGIKPAPLTTDWEFVRRVTLDLTGRIPTPARATSFVMTRRRTNGRR